MKLVVKIRIIILTIYNKIKKFIDKHFDSVFSFDDILVKKTLEPIEFSTLKTKKYQFGNSEISSSQFHGLKNSGPYLPIDTQHSHPKICFIYKKDEKGYSYDLYYALNGKTFPTFPGMGKMFDFLLDENTVIGRGVDEYSLESIKGIIKDIKNEFPTDLIVPILIVSWSKATATEEQQELYYKLKHLFLINRMPSQFICIDKIKNDNILKWAVSSFAVQIFSKLGGSPWVLIPQTSHCLIIGIGQAYQKNENSKIKKFFSYSILTDTTGLFKGIKILADTNNKEEYAENLSNSLKQIIKDYDDEYHTFVVHTSFRMNDKDIKIIKTTLDEIKKGNDLTFAILRFDDNHDYLCFDTTYNSLVPLESSKVSLSYSKYLMWFEGLQYHKPLISHRIGTPIKISIDYPRDITLNKIDNYLQDSINLSGANWRGFNAKSVPVSLLYAELISHFIAAFDKYDLSRINIETITPWFL
ncbi:MAG: Piwi domain-containing protein [Treponemataceae bacterium]